MPQAGFLCAQRVVLAGRWRYFSTASNNVSTMRACNPITTSSAAFEEIAKFLWGNFEVLPFDRMADALRRPDANRRAVFLMCDDGYANNLRAADILESFGLPWTLFVSTWHIDTAERSPVFIARLFALFAPEGRHEIPHLGTVRLGSGRDEAIADRLVLRLKALDAAKAGEAVAVDAEVRWPTFRLCSSGSVPTRSSHGIKFGS